MNNILNMNSNINPLFIFICLLGITISGCTDDNDGSPAALNLPVLHVSDITVSEEDEDKVIHW